MFKIEHIVIMLHFYFEITASESLWLYSVL